MPGGILKWRRAVGCLLGPCRELSVPVTKIKAVWAGPARCFLSLHYMAWAACFMPGKWGDKESQPDLEMKGPPHGRFPLHYERRCRKNKLSLCRVPVLLNILTHGKWINTSIGMHFKIESTWIGKIDCKNIFQNRAAKNEISVIDSSCCPKPVRSSDHKLSCFWLTRREFFFFFYLP